jgi:hypothetical protein
MPTPEHKMKTPYRRSIWKSDARYRPPAHKKVELDLRLIARLQSIEAAKKRTPPISIANLLRLATLLQSPLTVQEVNAAKVATYLTKLRVYGCGIKTAACMLAVFSKGEFPPMDEKLAAGLFKKGWITNREAAALNGAGVKAFSKAYVESVIPRWAESRSRGDLPEKIDQRWAKWANS